jgi:nucleotide-binding universal stress UspA family protein
MSSPLEFGTPSPRAPSRIVVGYDGSESAARALRFAMGLEGKVPGELWVVHASEVPPGIAEPRTDEEQRTETSAIEQTLAALSAEGERHGRRITVWIREGGAARVLLDAAEQVHADLIVVGTRGLRSSARLLLGSVSAAVIGQAKCPVTVIP